MCARRRCPVAYPHTATLGFVGLEEAMASPALHDGSEHPAQPDGITDTGVHAVAAGRHDLVGRVTGQPHTAIPITVGKRQARAPRVGADDVAVELDAELREQKLLGLDRFGVGTRSEQGVQCPGVAIVLGDQRPSLGRLGVPRSAEPLE